jgi:hypothetical protein
MHILMAIYGSKISLKWYRPDAQKAQAPHHWLAPR